MNEQERATQNPVDIGKSISKEPVSSIIPDLAYYPGFGKHGKKRHPDEKLIPYAEACIDMVRLLNNKAAQLYDQLLQICNGPECQEIFTRLKLHSWRRPYDTACLLETFHRDGPSKAVDEDIAERMGGLHYPPSLTKAMDDFILYGFNKTDDIKNEAPKVVLEDCYPLFIGLSTLAFYDALGLPEPLYNRVKQGSVSDLFGKDPASRPERRRKRKIIETFRSLGCGAVSKQTLLYGAELWYKSRVKPGKLVLVCDDLHISDPSILSHWIKPYDDATGFPRKLSAVK